MAARVEAHEQKSVTLPMHVEPVHISEHDRVCSIVRNVTAEQMDCIRSWIVTDTITMDQWRVLKELKLVGQSNQKEIKAILKNVVQVNSDDFRDVTGKQLENMYRPPRQQSPAPAVKPNAWTLRQGYGSM